jgi:8-oxo-dGTP pyrophosphatase MutT (NUDIX family)
MREAAHAIILIGDRYVLQLRDERPDITASGKWSLFGGCVEPGEDPATAVRRELKEELGVNGDDWRRLWSFERVSELDGQTIRIHLFSCRIDRDWPNHALTEGKDVRAFAFDELAGLDIPKPVSAALERFHRRPSPAR